MIVQAPIAFVDNKGVSCTVRFDKTCPECGVQNSTTIKPDGDTLVDHTIGVSWCECGVVFITEKDVCQVVYNYCPKAE